MSDYYIRTPEQDESRGPFDIAKLSTLAEAQQVTPSTLYYDEDKEEWLPIASNSELHALVFPEPEKLSLSAKPEETPKKKKKKGKGNAELNVETMLAQAEGDTVERRKVARKKKSFEKATALAAVGLGVMMILSALFMILPLMPVIQQFLNEGHIHYALDFPTVLFAIFDITVGVLLLLTVTDVYPLARARAMLGMGFGVYIGWALGDPIIMGASAAAGIGIFVATIAQRLGLMMLAFALGIGGNGFLAYLALNGRFDGFFDKITLNLVGQ